MTLEQRPTHARRTVLLLGFLVAVISYLDRVCISVAAPSMTADLGLTTIQMGYVFSAFALAYGIFEIPMGWLGDRYGQRRLLTRIVICWSVFTIMTGMARSYIVLVGTRFIFGAAEAGAFPTLARALARWFPGQDRGRVNGTMWMGARIGGALAPAIAVLFIAAVGWRFTFAIFGAIGFVWCVFFWRWYRDDPADHPSVNGAELDYITSGRARPPRETSKAPMPWGRLFRNRTMWFLFAMYFCSAYGYYFFVTWLPTYLMDEYGLTLQRSGFYAGLPLAAGAIGCISGGTFSDWLVRRTGSMRWGRRLVGIGGFILAAVGFGGAAMAGDPLAAVLWMAVAQGSQDLTLPVAWATCVDVGGRFGGTATGFMNTASSISAMISPLAAAWLQEAFGSFNAMFVSAVAVYFIGGLLWFVIDAEDRIVPEEKEQLVNG